MSGPNALHLSMNGCVLFEVPFDPGFDSKGHTGRIFGTSPMTKKLLSKGFEPISEGSFRGAIHQEASSHQASPFVGSAILC